MISRKLTQSLARSKKSVLLLGPRQAGKSTLITSLSPDLTFNLAHERTYLEFARNPGELEEQLAAFKAPRTVFIDEVQRLPSVLNTIQVLLDTARFKGLRFLLTGSSARKLRRGHANLLPGRVFTYQLGPLVAAELGYQLNTRQALQTGSLPGIYTDESHADRIKALRSYSATYLKEEVQAEALTRNLEGFARFLFVAAASAGNFLDLSKLASDAAITRQSAIRFFEILEDTLIIHRCEPFTKSARKRLLQHPKFYFFDTGVLNALQGSFETSTDRIGGLFEHLVFSQLLHGAASSDQDIRISSFRTEHGAEVDFIVEFGGDVWAIEVKASTNIDSSDLRGLKRFRDFYEKPHRSIVVYLGTAAKRIEHVDILPWQDAIKEMGL